MTKLQLYKNDEEIVKAIFRLFTDKDIVDYFKYLSYHFFIPGVRYKLLKNWELQFQENASAEIIDKKIDTAVKAFYAAWDSLEEFIDLNYYQSGNEILHSIDKPTTLREIVNFSTFSKKQNELTIDYKNAFKNLMTTYKSKLTQNKKLIPAQRLKKIEGAVDQMIKIQKERELITVFYSTGKQFIRFSKDTSDKNAISFSLNPFHYIFKIMKTKEGVPLKILIKTGNSARKENVSGTIKRINIRFRKLILTEDLIIHLNRAGYFINPRIIFKEKA